MAKYMNIVVVQYPRGATALIWLDPASGTIVTSHAGLQAALRRGVRDWQGGRVFPHDGPIFLEAVYDQLFMGGYAVRWTRLAGVIEVQRSYRV
jgi:hypothetical protein